MRLRSLRSLRRLDVLFDPEELDEEDLFELEEELPLELGEDESEEGPESVWYRRPLPLEALAPLWPFLDWE